MILVRSDDEQLHHSLAVAGTLLLQLGETQKSFQTGIEKQIDDAMRSTSDDDPVVDATDLEEAQIPKSTSKMGDLKSWLVFNARSTINSLIFSIQDGDWCLQIEHIIATIMAEPCLSEFFELKYSLIDLINDFRQKPMKEKTQKQ